MIRILQCVSNMHRAGIETIIMRYYRNIDRSKVQFDFLINKDNVGEYEEEIKRLGGRIFFAPSLNPLKINQYKKYVKKILKENPEIKIVHAHNDAMEYPVLLAAKEADFPIRIAHSHNTSLDFDKKWPVKIIYKNKIPGVANFYFACGKEASKYMFNESHAIIIHNALPFNEFKFNDSSRKEIRKKYHIPDNTLLIGHIGRFSPQKNHEFILQLIKNLEGNYKFMLIGEGEKKVKIIDKIKSLNLSDRVIFVNSTGEINKYYSAFDAFILPSKYEGLPLVSIEAQTAGLPVLLSDTITEECKILQNVKFIPLDVHRWISEIKKITPGNRIISYDDFKNSNYDIVTEAIKLQNIYEKLTKGEMV